MASGRRCQVSGVKFPGLLLNIIKFKGRKPGKGTIMNKIVKRAYEINRKAAEFSIDLPDLEIGDVVRLGDVWDGEEPYTRAYNNNSYSYIISDLGEDGATNVDIYINYVFNTIGEDRKDEMNSLVKIISIELI